MMFELNTIVSFSEHKYPNNNYSNSTTTIKL